MRDEGRRIVCGGPPPLVFGAVLGKGVAPFRQKLLPMTIGITKRGRPAGEPPSDYEQQSP
jgi:hypothetical protein